jgi:hypothetical protein
MNGPDTRTSLPSRRNLSNRSSESYGSRMRCYSLDAILAELEAAWPEDG